MFKGAVIMGYQGIGKSTVAKDISTVIDLESSLMKYPDGTRPENWEKLYCNQAINLAKRKRIVFVSSHEVVQYELSEYCKNNELDIWIGAIAPWYSLKDEWIEKLNNRYEETGKSKDYRAWMNAKDGDFNKQIRILSSNPFFPTIFLYNRTYDLDFILSKICSIMDIDVAL